MTDASSIFVVVPCFNEARVIRDTVNVLLQRNYIVVVVDDASGDNTREMLTGLPVHYIRHEVNLGQGAALQTGLEYALEQGANWIVTFDADGQHDVNDIPVMMDVMQKKNAGIVFGSRFMEGGRANVTTSRKLILRTARLINYFASGILLTDANNGLRLINREAALKMRITENRSTHSAQIQDLIRRNQIVFAECPVHISYTDYSRSKGIRNIASIRILYELILFKIFR
ncbi:MAG: glycosyltransferase family 2 protein [Citrobacter freundii]|nr:MAG: glycosyltransferase family 2 protein [Citrobacter freundii]